MSFLNTFFSNMIVDLKISDCNNCDPFVEKNQEPICEPKVIVSLLQISHHHTRHVRMKTQSRCIKNLRGFRYSTETINKNTKIFTIYQSEFQSILKLANITHFKKGDRSSNKNYRPEK